MGLFKSTQEVLVVANNTDTVVVWSVDRINQWHRNCAVYLHIILER